MSLLEEVSAQTARRQGPFADFLGDRFGRAESIESSELFRYFWDDTPPREEAFGFKEFPNITPPSSRSRPLFVEGEAPQRAIAWSWPLLDGSLEFKQDIGFETFGALMWREEREVDSRYWPAGAISVVGVCPTGQHRAGGPSFNPLFWWAIPVGADGRARPMGSGNSVALMVDSSRRTTGASMDLLIKSNRDALYIALFALSCVNAPTQHSKLLDKLDRVGSRDLGIGHGMAACRHLFIEPDADAKSGG